MTLRRTKVFYQRFKLTCQQKKTDSTENDILLVKSKKPNIFTRCKIKSKKSYSFLKQYMRKKPVPKKVPVEVQRRLSDALSEGLEPPNIDEVVAFHKKVRANSSSQIINMWLNESSIFSSTISKESKNISFDLCRDNRFFAQCVNGQLTKKEMRVLSNELLGNLYNMQRLQIEDRFFEDVITDVIERNRMYPLRGKQCKAPIMCTINNSDWKECINFY